MDIHHIRPFRYYSSYEAANELSNLVLLCRSCHAKTDVEIRQSNVPELIISQHSEYFNPEGQNEKTENKP